MYASHRVAYGLFYLSIAKFVLKELKKFYAMETSTNLRNFAKTNAIILKLSVQFLIVSKT